MWVTSRSKHWWIIMSQTNFICPSSCIDFFVSPNGTKFACCKDGIYALTSTDNNDSLDFDEAEDDIFAEPKKPCRVPSVSKDIDGVLRVKFKREALCFTVLDKIIFSLHLHRNGNQAICLSFYIDANCICTCWPTKWLHYWLKTSKPLKLLIELVDRNAMNTGGIN